MGGKYGEKKVMGHTCSFIGTKELRQVRDAVDRSGGGVIGHIYNLFIGMKELRL